MTDVAALPFDQYQRYRLVADMIDRLRAERPVLEILDVGGRTALLRSFLPEDTVHLVDMEASDEDGLVLGDGAKLPFRDGAFDVVCAFDTLEHVPPAMRDEFVKECARVTRGHVLLAGPYTSPEVDEAEELLQQFLNDKLDLQHRYLEEHRTHGLPDRERTETLLREAGCVVTNHGHGNLDRWLVLMCMEMYMDHDPLLRPIAERFFRFYNENLYASDHAVPVYRHVVVAAKSGCELPSVEGILSEPQAPEGALKVTGNLGLELLAFDRERDVWQPEMERLKGIIDDQIQDIAGHRASLETARKDLAAHDQTLSDLRATYDEMVAASKKTRADLEADLHAHKAAHSDLKVELDAQVKRYDEGLAERDAERETFQGDLKTAQEGYEKVLGELREVQANHEQGVADFEAERQNLAKEIEVRDQHVADLKKALFDQQALAERMTQDLEQARSDSASSNERLSLAESKLEQTRSLLRDRKASLKRAFGPKKPTP